MLVSEYTLCIDGGGSHASLQVLDRQGQILNLTKEGVTSDQITLFESSNINSIGEEQFQKLFQELFKNVQIGSDLKPLSKVIGQCSLVAAIAGLGLGVHPNKQKAANVFSNLGISKMYVFGDADMGLELMPKDGVLVIAGTGSICLAKKDGRIVAREGGWGWRLGDEGSATRIGSLALRAGLQLEWEGKETELTRALKKYYAIEKLSSLLPELNSLDKPMAPGRIAGSAKVVLEIQNDSEVDRIVQKAAAELNELIAQALTHSQIARGVIQLVGGCFKGRMGRELRVPREFTIQNNAHQNPAVLYAQKQIHSAYVSRHSIG